MRYIISLALLLAILFTSIAWAGQVCFWQKGYFCPIGTSKVDSGTYQFEHYVMCCD